MFVPLRVHSVFSRGRGSVALEEVAAWASRRRLPAAALADAGNLYGWGKWKRAAAAAGVKPIFGCELEVGGRRFVFLVRRREGYANLVEIFNRREVRSAEGLVVIYVPETSSRAPLGFKAGGEGEPAEKNREKSDGPEGKTGRGGPAGDGPGAAGSFRSAMDDGREAGESGSRPLSGRLWPHEAAMIADLRDKVPAGDLYIGADFANFRRLITADPLADLPVVWANPLKYLTSPERLILVHAVEKKIPYPPERDRLLARVRSFGPDQEAAALRRFGGAAKEALALTFEVAEKCEFGFDDIVPNLPADLFPRTLRDVVMERLAAAPGLSWRERQRALRELAAVESSGFGPYFLVVHDIVEFARRRGILHNLRGSGASSFLTHLLGLSHINPMTFDLYFERFLNRGRPDPPDIDIDFDSRRRDEVLEYVLATYGAGSRTGAAYVCSLKNFRARSALYETLRAFGVPPDEARGYTRRVPYFAEPAWLRTTAPAPGFLEVWKLAAELQDVHHEISLHVGGVILTPAPVERCLPLDMSAKGLRMTHFDKDAVEDLRLIKLDLLSVRGLAAISETTAGLGLRAIPPDDAKTYALLRSARTIGCFQVESPAMRNLLRRMKPADIHEVTQALALVRPGPTESGMKEALLRRRSGGRAAAGKGAGPRSAAGGPVPGNDAFLARILPETAGILLYEEQVMQIAERAAGMPPEEGDLLRRSLKRRRGGDEALRGKFFREAAERGYAAGDVERLWRTMEKFSAYAFNKAHSASYAHMAYQAVYLKVHHPVPYFAAVLNSGGGYYDLPEYVAEAKRNGIRLLGPDANRSLYGFEVEDGPDGGAIRVGFTSIKGLGLKTIDRVVGDRRESGPYASVEDFLVRLKPSKADLLSLIRAGVFDALEPRRTRQILRYFQGLEHMEEVADVAADEKRRMLYESLGFLPDGDDLDLFEGRRPDLRIRDLADCPGTMVELVVRVVDARQRETCGASGGPKFFYMFEDETGILEGIGESPCAVYGTPPVCFLRGEVRKDREGVPKIHNCSFLKSF